MFHVRGNCLNAAGSDWFFSHMVEGKGNRYKMLALSLWALLTTKFYILTIFYGDHFKLFHTIFETLTISIFLKLNYNLPLLLPKQKMLIWKHVTFLLVWVSQLYLAPSVLASPFSTGRELWRPLQTFPRHFRDFYLFPTYFSNLPQLLPEQTMLVWKPVTFLLVWVSQL